MMIVSKNDFDTYGMKATSSFISFKGKTFTRSQTFAKRFRKMAIAIAERNIEQGVPSFIVAFETHFTVWKQQQAECLSNQLLALASNPFPPLALASNPFPPLPDSPKKIKTHQPHPNVSPQLSPTSKGKQSSQSSEGTSSQSPLKYRGHHITSDSKSIVLPQNANVKLMYRGKSVHQDASLETDEGTLMDGQHSPSQPVKQPLPKRLMQYRGQWVHPESI